MRLYRNPTNTGKCWVAKKTATQPTLLLGELQSTESELPRKLDPSKAASYPIEKITMDKATFDRMHAENRMATDKLDEGIKGFAKALEQLEELLATKLAAIEGE